MPTKTIRLHRVLLAAPEKIYRAFQDPDAMAKWLPPNGFTGKVHEDGWRSFRPRSGLAGADVAEGKAF